MCECVLLPGGRVSIDGHPAKHHCRATSLESDADCSTGSDVIGSLVSDPGWTFIEKYSTKTN